MEYISPQSTLKLFQVKFDIFLLQQDKIKSTIAEHTLGGYIIHLT